MHIPCCRTLPMPAICVSALLSLAGSSAAMASNDPPVMLQWFEVRWEYVEHRMPDFFLAGYGSTWLPPATKCGSTGSAGYDVWDRFDFGKPGAQTAYGTESYFDGMVAEFHQASGLVYLDAVFNHCNSRQTSISFQSAGGYPGFWMAPSSPIVAKTPTSNWGDFHAGNASGYLQSHDPNGANYNLYNGDLVSLIDISHETNYIFIRQPVADGNPQNIPAGTTYNRPDPLNTRCYPDLQLPAQPVSNPGTYRNPGANNFTFHPYNNADQYQGDPVADNGTGMLMRWEQWMLDQRKVDGFRLDAIKHVPSWFWDTFFDAVAYQRRVTPDGRHVTPYSFGESVESASWTYDNYIRKPNNNSNQSWRAGDTWGNRDCIDINGSGELRNLVNAGGLGSWQTVLNAHLDNADGYNDGTLGVNHTFSHDNGTTGDGNSAPPDPTAKQQGWYTYAYVLMRPGQSEVYHNGRGLNRSSGFWPKQGVPVALGLDPVSNTANPVITNLVQLHNFYARGEFNILNYSDPVNQSLADVLVFERRKNLGAGSYSANVLVGVSDSYSNGTQSRSVLTSFPSGTRLLEMTGNAADATVDPTGIIPEVLPVDASQRVLITVPNNKNVNGVEHNKGFVVYGPAVPSGTLSFTNISSTLPADLTALAAYRRRLASIPVITANSFQIQLTTTNGDPGAGNNNNADDNAVFRIDQGYRDFNGNGVVDIDYTNDVVPGYEQFVTVHQPLAGTNNTTGQYAQTIDATQLSEGFHYVSVVAFRKRSATDDSLFREFRQVVYIDRSGPLVTLTAPAANQHITATSFKFIADAADRTATKVHIIYDLPIGSDPIAAAVTGNLATKNDRFNWVRTVSGLTHGWHRITVVAFEESGNSAYQDNDVFVDLCPSDINDDGFVNGDDFDTFVELFELGDMGADYDGNTFVNGDDFDSFTADFEAGC